VGGVIFSSSGNTKFTFSWSLRTTTNNQVKAYFLLQKLFLARQQVLDFISILRDSKVVINHVKKKTLLSYMKLRAIFTIIHNELEVFHTLDPYHVLRHNNVTTDGQANLAIRDDMGILRING
jgi:ribonuclease HI